MPRDGPALAARLVDKRNRDGMGRRFLGRCGELDHLAFADAGRQRDDRNNLRPAFCYRAGLVKHQGVGFGEHLQVVAAFDQDAVARRGGDGGRQRGRGGKPDSA